jgi:hypothetical protein
MENYRRAKPTTSFTLARRARRFTELLVDLVRLLQTPLFDALLQPLEIRQKSSFLFLSDGPILLLAPFAATENYHPIPFPLALDLDLHLFLEGIPGRWDGNYLFPGLILFHLLQPLVPPDRCPPSP